MRRAKFTSKINDMQISRNLTASGILTKESQNSTSTTAIKDHSQRAIAPSEKVRIVFYVQGSTHFRFVFCSSHITDQMVVQLAEKRRPSSIPPGV